MSDNLTPKQERFVREYLVDLNATQAAIRAGYSKATAKQQGSRLLTHADVGASIEQGQRTLAARTQVTVDIVVAGLLHEARHAKQSSSRVAALAWLGKHLGMFTDRIDVRHHLLGAYEALTTEELRALAAPATEEMRRLLDGGPSDN